MKIRRLTADDAEQYQSLRLFALRESPTAFSASYEDELDRPLESVGAMLADGGGSMFGAFDGSLIGTAGIEREAERNSRHCGFVHSVYVRPEARGHGVSRQLLLETLAHARTIPGLRQLRLVVTASNVEAVALYRSLGFQPWGYLPEAILVGGAYYDDLHMWLILDASSTPALRAVESRPVSTQHSQCKDSA